VNWLNTTHHVDSRKWRRRWTFVKCKTLCSTWPMHATCWTDLAIFLHSYHLNLFISRAPSLTILSTQDLLLLAAWLLFSVHDWVIHFCSSSMHFLTQALLLMAARYGEPGLAVRNTCYTCERPGMVDERGGEYATNHFYFLLQFMALTERWGI
jgi:hypothetical protein